MTAVLPRGWGADAADPSVGIFGDVVWHDDCPVFGADEAAVVAEADAEYTGKGAAREVIVHYRATCPACGAVAEYAETHYDPEDVEPR